ncbi:hypothetical protein LTR08_005527 [Meristemomyces frigidus]|nr:hypothetical protein LTR08_005527 [Meristemomyces frigidus]
MPSTHVLLGTDFFGAQDAVISYPDRQITLGQCGGARIQMKPIWGWPSDENPYWRSLKAVAAFRLFQTIECFSSEIPKTLRAVTYGSEVTVDIVKRLITARPGSGELEELATASGLPVSIEVPWDSIVRIKANTRESVFLAVEDEYGFGSG